MQLTTRHTREKAELVVQELLATAEREQKRAEYYSDLTSQIYTHEEDNTFAESQEGIQRVLTFFKKSELARLATLATKERARVPTNEEALTELIFMPEQRAARDNSNQRGRKRARNSKNNSRNNTPNPANRNNEASTSTNNQAPATTGNGPAQPRSNPQPQRYNGPADNPQPRYGGNPTQQRPRSQGPNPRYEPANQNRHPQQQSHRQQAPRNRPQQPNAPRQQQQRQPSNNPAPQHSASTDRLLSALSVLKDYMG